MGSFSWMCCCGCGREITPTYTKVLEDCSKCGDTTLDGQEVVVLMPDGKNIVGHYNDYGNVKVDGVNVIDLYGWLGRANEPTKCETMKDANEENFWAKAHDELNIDANNDEDRMIGINIDTGENSIASKWPIKIGWSYCVNHNDNYEDYEKSGGAPNQGFGNAISLDCCERMICAECADQSSIFNDYCARATSHDCGSGGDEMYVKFDRRFQNDNV